MEPEVTPAHELIERTPEGLRRIRGQKRPTFLPSAIDTACLASAIKDGIDWNNLPRPGPPIWPNLLADSPFRSRGGAFLKLESSDASMCLRHGPREQEQDRSWSAERESVAQLPMVNVSLGVLGPNLKQIVASHGGILPLATVIYCYAAEFEALVVDTEEGVPLEHLVTCIRGLKIQQSPSGNKTIVEDETLNNSFGSTSTLSTSGCASALQSVYAQSLFSSSTDVSSASSGQPPVASHLAQFSREIADLLKIQPGCKMQFSKFIPQYHHYFGKQLRVADYGFTKLKELLEAVPHVVQIIGEGTRSVLTLTHRAQIKRFTADLMRMLKASRARQMKLAEFSQVYEKVMSKPFRVWDYGVCEVEDLLLELSETTVVLSGSGEDMEISVPKREQTLDEIERTHQFAAECVELLRRVQDCRLPFNQFIPAYHHLFGRQCRVSEYGFSKLIELFEAVPGTVEVTEDVDGERVLQLTDSERLSVIGNHIEEVIRSQSDCAQSSGGPGNGLHQDMPAIVVGDLPEAYFRQFGLYLRPESLGHETLLSLLKTLGQTVRLESVGDCKVARLIDRSYVKALSAQVRHILGKQEDGTMKVDEFAVEFKKCKDIDFKELQIDLPDLVIVDNNKASDQDKDDENNNPDGKEATDANACGSVIRLTPLQLCASRIENLINECDGKVLCSDLEAVFSERYKTPLCPGKFGFPSVITLIKSGLPKFFAIRGRGNKRMITVAQSPDDEQRSSMHSSSFSSSSNQSVGAPEGHNRLFRSYSDFGGSGTRNNYSFGNSNYSWRSSGYGNNSFTGSSRFRGSTPSYGMKSSSMAFSSLSPAVPPATPSMTSSGGHSSFFGFGRGSQAATGSSFRSQQYPSRGYFSGGYGQRVPRGGHGFGHGHSFGHGGLVPSYPPPQHRSGAQHSQMFHQSPTSLDRGRFQAGGLAGGLAGGGASASANINYISEQLAQFGLFPVRDSLGMHGPSASNAFN